jgi:ATP phosphoribosyltransferase regulatory subunit
LPAILECVFPFATNPFKERRDPDHVGTSRLTFADLGLGAILAHLTGAGYQCCEPPILQPASIFFDSGEDLRGQLYLTSDVSGAEYCLRPEYTIPVSLHYLACGRAGESAAYSYCGPVFRFEAAGPCEFVQAGIESFGRADREAADAEILALTEGAIAAEKSIPDLSVRIGDAGLFARLLEALDLAPQWQRRISRGHTQGKPIASILAAGMNGAGIDHSGVLALLEGADKRGARALVEDLLRIAGISAVGGRTAAEIAERFLEQAALRTGDGVPAEKRLIIERFLAIDGSPDEAAKELRKLAAESRLDLAFVLDCFDRRLELLKARGLDVAGFFFAARFTRNLDYYTGFVFDLEDRARPGLPPVAGGGRYDQLLRRLGAKTEIPAVGAAIRIDRLARSKSPEGA